MVGFLAAACVLTYVSRHLFGVEKVFTHLFYVPIFMSCLWWKRKGLIVPILLSGVVLVSHDLLRDKVPVINDILRAVMFTGVGAMVALLTERAERAEEEKDLAQKRLDEALTRVLSGFIPICASCKRIRDEKGVWHPVEAYIHDRTEARFSHGICPECGKKLYGDFYPDKG